MASVELSSMEVRRLELRNGLLQIETGTAARATVGTPAVAAAGTPVAPSA